MWKVMRYVGDDVTSDPREYWQGGSSEKYYSTMSSGGPYSYRNDFDGTDVGNRYEMVEATTCLPVGSYVFALYDVSGDGICCDYGRGEYGINLSRGKVIRPLSLGEFSGHVEATFFEVAAEDIDVSPPSSAAEDNPPSAPCASFEMHLVLDQFGNETSWEVVLSDDHPTASPGDVGTRYLKSSKDQRKTQESSVATKVVLSGGPYSYKGDFESEAVESHYNAIVAETCLPVGSYNFVLYDVGGDGICCDYGRGEYGIALKNGRVVRPLSHGGFSGASEITPFEVTADDVDVFPEGYSHPNDVVVATADADAAACPGDVFECPYGGGYLSRDPENDCEFGDCPLVNHDYAADVYAGGDASSTDDAEISPVVQNTSVIAPTTTVDSLNSFVTVTDIDVTTGRGKSYGVLFDIEATQTLSSLVIAGMDLYLDKTSPTHYEIWTKQGSWQLMENENSDYFEGFHQVSHGSITGKGPSEFTKIEIKDFHEVNIEGGQRQAFWVTLSDNNLIFKNNEGEGVSRHEIGSVVQAASEAFNVYFGAAVRAYPLENADPMTDFWYNAGFLGRVWYKAI
ncbi:hypothetical protein ACHAW5_008211 [Stephanodiscus triporus]|uniref:Uncharacterized protein n=1 Tax=Stephanodiscus triporus TaxID=2934178 RepID=A0ABD3NDB0_9STRA